MKKRDALTVDPNECRCGHDQSDHHPDGKCKLYQGEPMPVEGSNVFEYPPGACYCKRFDSSPWRWVVWEHYSPPFPTSVGEDGRVWTSLAGKEPDGYGVSRQNREKKYGPYKRRATAERKCEELNRLMLCGPLEPEFARRYERLKRLCPDFGSYFYEGAPEARWPMRPERFLIQGHDDGWHGEHWDELADTPQAVQEVLESDVGHEVFRVIDLDTGDEVAYDRDVSVILRSGAA